MCVAGVKSTGCSGGGAHRSTRAAPSLSCVKHSFIVCSSRLQRKDVLERMGEGGYELGEFVELFRMVLAVGWVELVAAKECAALCCRSRSSWSLRLRFRWTVEAALADVVGDGSSKGG